MALIICPECGKEISNQAHTCPNCGAPISAEISRNINSSQNQLPPEIKPRKKKKTGIILLVIFIILAITASSVVCGLIFLRPRFACFSARKLIDEGNYKEAVRKLNGIKQTDETAELFDLINEKVEEYIEEIMSDGDYVKALKKLNEYSSVPVYDKLFEEIKYESIAVKCMLNLKPILKNPNSLQANSISFYNSDTDDAKYPLVIITNSGQNGFGGYSNSYSIFSVDDLSYMGSCDSLNSDDCDDKYERMVCDIILLYRENGELNVDFDLHRINKIFSDNISPNVEVEQFAESNQTPA